MFGPVVLVTICWLVFIFYWLISAFSAKQYARRNFTSWGVRVGAIVLILLAYQVPSFRDFLINERFYAVSPALQWLGVILCACGIGFAIWARFYLGTNWGMPMTLKQDPELVTSGPYHYVRHPIYSGMILAMLGTTLVTIWWVIPFIFFLVYFVYSAKAEEKIMLEEFGDRYADYMKRSKMLIPFVF
jgi:protein-S-isoprenylcysteine O-methyltransferase Ste14